MVTIVEDKVRYKYSYFMEKWKGASASPDPPGSDTRGKV